MNNLGIEARLEKFVRDYGQINLEKGGLTTDGYACNEQMLKDVGYELTQHYPKVFARTATKGVDVVIWRDLTTLNSGISYLQLGGVNELHDFEQKYNSACSANEINPASEGFFGGICGTGVGAVFSIIGYMFVDLTTGGALSTGTAIASFVAPTVLSGGGFGTLRYRGEKKFVKKSKANFVPYQKIEYSVGLLALRRALDLSVQDVLEQQAGSETELSNDLSEEADERVINNF